MTASFNKRNDTCRTTSANENKINNNAQYRTTSTSLKSTIPAVVIPPSCVGPYDVLCGRNKSAFQSIGNKRFRILIELYLPRYEAAITKSQTASVIVYICGVLKRSVGVRFLRIAAMRNIIGQEEQSYVLLNELEIRKKVGHALRDMSVARQGKLNGKRRQRRTSSNIGMQVTTATQPTDEICIENVERTGRTSIIFDINKDTIQPSLHDPKPDVAAQERERNFHKNRELAEQLVAALIPFYAANDDENNSEQQSYANDDESSMFLEHRSCNPLLLEPLPIL